MTVPASRPQLTVLTDPVIDLRHALPLAARFAARRVRNAIHPPPAYYLRQYRGHFAVTRSLVEGLKKIGVNANYNPSFRRQLGESVIVLSGLGTLAQAIEFKRAGRIRRLLAGPNLLVFPSDHPELIAAPEVDLCITPSQMMNGIYEADLPALRGRTAAWPAGVDTEFWSPDPAQRDPKHVLVFAKNNPHPVGAVEPYVRMLEGKGYTVSAVAYGNYMPPDYRALLRRAAVMIGFASQESQGIAWAEAWSADVPTLLFHPGRTSYPHPRYRGVLFDTTTAPYLTRETGLFFRDPAEFENVFAQWERERDTFHPRRWVLANMSDEASARRLCELAGVTVP